MPGLVGIIGKGPMEERGRELDRMVAAMYRKEHILSGSYKDEERGIYVGWTCHKSSYADCLPIQSPSGDLTMFFAGEHYALDAEEEARLAKRNGCAPDNATSLLPLYREYGEKFFAYLNGFFHGLIIDRLEGRIMLFNDRFGMQRLYYFESPEAFYFASEAKSLLAVRKESRAFDLRGLGEWLSCGCVLENRSLFKGIDTLAGGSFWTWKPGSACAKKAYFSPREWEEQAQLPPEDFYANLRATFKDRLPAYLGPDGRIGMSVTGGLDTRMILANIAAGRAALRCYTFNGPVRENLDVSIGRRVAHAAGFEHTTLAIDREFFRRFDRLAEDLILSADGNLGINGLPELYLNERAREISPIRLNGNYGSEVLRRYRSFKAEDPNGGLFVQDVAESIRQAKETWTRTLRAHPLTYVLFKQIPWFSYNRLQSELALLTMRAPFMDNALLKMMYRAPDESTASNLISLRLIRDGNPALADILTDRGVSYPKRASWPLTRAYYEFIFKMEYYASHGMPRRLASIDRRLGSLSLERNFLGRNKYYHLRQWFRDELRPYVRDILLTDDTTSGCFLNRHNVAEIVDSHLAGEENHTHTIDKLLAIALTSKVLLGAGARDILSQPDPMI